MTITNKCSHFDTDLVGETEDGWPRMVQDCKSVARSAAEKSLVVLNSSTADVTLQKSAKGL